MKKCDEMVLSERQKGVVAAMLWEEARAALGMPDDPEHELGDNTEFVKRIARWETNDWNVDRDTCVALNDKQWPDVQRVESLCTTISHDDHSSARMEHLVVFEDVCVRLKLYFPQPSDNECDGCISGLSLYPAAEADSVWDSIQQDFVKDVVGMAMKRVPGGFEHVLRAAAGLRAASMTPQAGPQ